METRINEIADGIYRLSTFVPEIAPPAGFTFNQFLILGDEPLLFHTGLRKMFPLIRSAVSRLIPPERLRWVAFGHYEADECGAMNEWLAVAPQAEVAHGQTGCLVSLNDMADRPPRSPARRRSDRPRQGEAGPLPRYATYPAWLGGGCAVRRDEQDPAVRRPVHPARRRPGVDRVRYCRAGDLRRGHVQVFKPECRHAARRSAGLRSSRRAHWRSCTVLPLPEMARLHCAHWLPTTIAASPIACPSPRPRESRARSLTCEPRPSGQGSGA